MRRTVREDCEDEYGQHYFIVKIVGDDGRTIRRMDGSERIADSRRCKDPYDAVEKPTCGLLRYSSKGIV